MGVDVPHDLRSQVALESIVIAKGVVTKAWDELPKIHYPRARLVPNPPTPLTGKHQNIIYPKLSGK